MRKKTKNQAGFSLFEVIITITLIALLATVSTSISFENLHGHSFAEERDSLVLSLQQIRNDAMSGSCIRAICTQGASSGIHIENNTYTLFEGETYDAENVTNETTHMHSNNRITGPANIIFERLSGNATASEVEQNITLTDTFSRTSIITITNEGGISWTN